MKKFLNGQIVDMTAEEISHITAEAERMAEEMKNTPPTEAERLESIEMAILELAEVMANG